MTDNDRVDTRVETTFEIEQAPEDAWRVLRDVAEQRGLGPGEWWLPGFESRGTEVEANPARRLEIVKADQPCQGTTIVFTFEHIPSGSRIHVVQSGFDPDFVRAAGEQFWRHGRQLLNDLERFFRTASPEVR